MPLRKLDPRKQGLKHHTGSSDGQCSSVTSKARSTKTRIETHDTWICFAMSSQPSKARSTKTRIETHSHCQILASSIALRKLDPRKQGLKPSFRTHSRACSMILRKLDPRKQGLKPCILVISAELRIRSSKARSTKTRIETLILAHDTID